MAWVNMSVITAELEQLVRQALVVVRLGKKPPKEHPLGASAMIGFALREGRAPRQTG